MSRTSSKHFHSSIYVLYSEINLRSSPINIFGTFYQLQCFLLFFEAISPNLLVWRFFGNAQFPNTVGIFSVIPVSAHFPWIVLRSELTLLPLKLQMKKDNSLESRFVCLVLLFYWYLCCWFLFICLFVCLFVFCLFFVFFHCGFTNDIYKLHIVCKLLANKQMSFFIKWDELLLHVKTFNTF